MRVVCLVADPSLAATPGAAELLADPRVLRVDADGPVGLDAGLADAFAWAQLLAEPMAEPDVAGAVAVLRVDVLAEVAYLLDLAVGRTKPLVATGAMRGPDHRAPDGLVNLGASLHLARHPALAGACATVVIAGRVHAARDVTRICAASVDAFASPLLGTLGLVGPDGPVTLTRRPPPREHLPATRIEPAVAHVAALLGVGPEAVTHAVAGGARGLVLETSAAGGVPPALGDAVARAVERGVVVVAASRARGVPRDEEGPGGLGWLRRHGVLHAAGLAPEKARIRLALALGLDGPGAVAAAFAPPTPLALRVPARRAVPPPSIR